MTPDSSESRERGLEIVVPARNEANRLPGSLAMLCDKAAALPVDTGVLVVDSASTDETPEIVRNWPQDPVPVRLTRCERPGKGTAVRAGILATSAPLVGFCDADMATNLSALDTALRLLLAGHLVVIGSRAHPLSEVDVRHSVLRRTGAVIFRQVGRRIVPGVSDSQCGFKFFAGPLVRAAVAPMVANGFAFDLELLARCQRLGAAVTEIPVHWTDVPGSTFSVLRHSLRTGQEVLAIWQTLRREAARAPRGSASAELPIAIVATAERGITSGDDNDVAPFP